MILQELLVPLRLDTSGFDGGIDKAISKGAFFGSVMGNIASSILSGGLDLLGRGLDRLGDFMGDAKEQASDLSESINAVNVVFEGGAGIIHEFGKTAADQVGLSNAKFHQLASVTGAFLTNLGLDSLHAADKTIELTKRAADMASVFNTDVSQALQAIQSGLKGEFDPLEQFGVKLSASAISAKAMEMGLADANGELDASAKSQAALALIMEQTDKLAGDFTKTSDGLANSQRILAARFDDIKARLGTALLPVLEKVQGMFLTLIDSDEFNAMVDGVVAALEGLGDFITTNIPLWQTKFRDLGEESSTTFSEMSRLVENLDRLLGLLGIEVDLTSKKGAILQGVLTTIASPISTLLGVLSTLNGFLMGVNATLEWQIYHLERIRSWFDGVSSSVWNLIYALARLSIPWWLTPGSPTPLENGLRGIGSAMADLNKNALPQFAANFNARQAAPSAGSSIDYHKFARIVAAELAKQYG